MKSYSYTKKGSSHKKVYMRFAGVVSILVGICMLVYFFFPVFSYQLFIAGAYAQGNIQSPLPKYLLVDSAGSNITSLLNQGVSALISNYDDAKNWYPDVPQTTANNSIKSYFLSIPTLKIFNATVVTTDTDLSKHLVQYYGSVAPPQNGTAVIFGHSTIPAWFDPHNYHTIFATLHTIKIGDEIDATVEGIEYKYEVYSITIINPDDTSMFDQKSDSSYITIITCTPPGTVWKRLIVRAKLTK